MNLSRSIRALMACALIASPLSSAAALRAEPLPPELNLVPREAAAFVSIRVADLWNDARAKPLRDFLAKEPGVLRDFEKDNGFKPEDVERVTFLIPGVNSRRVDEPWIIITFAKPHDLAKLLDAWHGISPTELRDFDGARRFESVPKSVAPSIKSGFDVKPDFKFDPKQFDGEKKFDLEIRNPKDFKIEPKFEFKRPFEKKEFIPPPKEIEKGESPVAFIQEKDEPPVGGFKAQPRDLKASYYMLRDGGFLIPINDRTYVVCRAGHQRDEAAIPELLAALLRRSDDGPLASALQTAAGKHALVAGVNLRAIKDAVPERGFAGVLPLDSILSSRSATLTFDLAEEMKFALQIDAPDAATAKRAHDVLKAIHVLGMEMLPGLKKLANQENEAEIALLISIVEPLLRSAEFDLKDTVVTATMKAKADAAWAKALTEAIEKTRQAAERTRSLNNLKQLALSVHNYHDAMGRFPFPGVSAPKGNPQGGFPVPNPNLSWRVALLPYIEEGNLYQQFRFDEPWDSEHNKKLIPMMPKIFAPLGGADAPKGHTFYRCFTSPGTFGAATTFVNITDGTSNTIMILEAGESIPWTKPDDLIYDPNKPLPKLGGHFKGKMNVAMGDGSVRTINLATISDATLRAAITANGGEVLGSDW